MISKKQLSDAEYLNRLSQGNHDAFDCLFDKYNSRIRIFIAQIIKCDTVAEDLAHDIFIKLWLNRENVSEIDSFNAYIYRLAKNEAFDYLKGCIVKTQYLFKQTFKEQSSQTEEDYFAREAELLVELIVEQMPKQRRRIFTMSRHDGLKNDEIAKRLNISKSTVENHLNTALNEIRKSLIILILILLANKL